MREPIGFLSDYQRVPPTTEAERIIALLELLRQRHCLLVLDNSEALFEPGHREGHYRGGLTGANRTVRLRSGAAYRRRRLAPELCTADEP